MLEAAMVLGVAAVVLTGLVDIITGFEEQRGTADVARYGTQVAAKADEVAVAGPDEARIYIVLATERYMSSKGFAPEDFDIDIWPYTESWNGRDRHFVQVSVSRKEKSDGRFRLIPEGLFESCYGSSTLIKSRIQLDTGSAIKNPECNPAGVASP